MTNKISDREELRDILLVTLSRFPHGIPLHDAYKEIEENFTFPEDWYRVIPAQNGYEKLKHLGFSNWREIPQKRLAQLVPTEPKWQNEIRWARNELNKRGLIDKRAARSVWRLTEKGIRAAAESLEGISEDIL